MQNWGEMIFSIRQAKMRWLQNPKHSNVDNLKTKRHKAIGHFRNKKKEILKAKIDDPEINSKIKNITDLHSGTSDFKKGYQPRTNVVKEEKGDLVTDSNSILAI
jgi:flagellar basal body rod protein FlgC